MVSVVAAARARGGFVLGLAERDISSECEIVINIFCFEKEKLIYNNVWFLYY